MPCVPRDYQPARARSRPGMWHLDSTCVLHHDAAVRTTVTLDKDVELMLRDIMHKSRQSFRKALNSTLRAGLGAKPPKARHSHFIVRARPMGLRAGIDPASLNQVADELEADGTMAKARRPVRL